MKWRKASGVSFATPSHIKAIKQYGVMAKDVRDYIASSTWAPADNGTTGSTWIELRNGGLRQGISAFARAAGLRHLTYVNNCFNLTSGKWPKNPVHRKECEREAMEFRLGDGRQRQKKTWPPCFMNWDLDLDVHKLERLIRSALRASVPTDEG